MAMISTSKSLPGRRPRPVSGGSSGGGVYAPFPLRDPLARCSVHLTNELLEEILEAGERNNARSRPRPGRKIPVLLPRPGPPPNRGLPPPPPPRLAHERQRTRKSTEEPYDKRRSLEYSPTTPNSNWSPPPLPPPPSPKPELSRSASEREAIQRKRRSRGEWVKARKERDMLQIRMMREKKLDGKPFDNDERNPDVWQEAITPPTTPSSSSSQNPPHPPHPPTQPSTPAMSPTLPDYHSSAQCASPTTTTSMQLEERVLALERKNKMLEQTIMAVIRTGIGPSRRGSFLLQAKALEEFLQELKLDE